MKGYAEREILMKRFLQGFTCLAVLGIGVVAIWGPLDPKPGPEVPCETDCHDYLTTCIEGVPKPDTLDSCVAACRVAKPRKFYACFHRPGGWCSALLPCWEAAQ